MKVKENLIKFNLLNKHLIYYKTYFGLNKLYVFYLNMPYIKGFKNFFSILELNFLTLLLKKTIKILFFFIKKNKKILFIGFNKPKVYNKNFIFMTSLKKEKKTIFKKKIPDLIVFKTNNFYKFLTLEKVLNFKVPIITFLNTNNKSNYYIYKIFIQNFNNKFEEFFFLLINNLIK